MSEPLVITLLNLKGGTSKTTSAVFIAHVLHEMGRKVVLVDADPQQSARDWNEDAPQPFPFPVHSLPTHKMHELLWETIGRGVDAVVIDTPPLVNNTGIVVSALRVATVAVIPMAPSPMEYQRLGVVIETVHQAAGFRPKAIPVPVAVLLNRVTPNARSTSIWRQQVRDDGIWCLEASVGHLQYYSQAYGDNIEHVLESSYADVVNEILAGGK